MRRTMKICIASTKCDNNVRKGKHIVRQTERNTGMRYTYDKITGEIFYFLLPFRCYFQSLDEYSNLGQCAESISIEIDVIVHFMY